MKCGQAIARDRSERKGMLASVDRPVKRCADQNDQVFAAWRTFAAIPEKEFAGERPLRRRPEIRKSPGIGEFAEA